tara:strand:+ start:1503 stop:2306 length:804 start_codon:yes stop_codon:yes gene_type:complete
MLEKNFEDNLLVEEKYKSLGNSPFESHKFDCSFETFVKQKTHFFPDSLKTDPSLGDNIYFSKSLLFNDYKGSTIFIAGGGPSTNNIDFNKIQGPNSEIDFIWSCNHFYLHPDLKNTKVDMAMIMGEPDIKSKDFLDYRNKFNPKIGFEFHNRWNDHDFDDYENYFLMHTNYYGRLGACVRMMIFACAIGAKKILFTGLDGPSYIKKGEHAFEKGKSNLPLGFDDRLYIYHYEVFWNHIHNSYPHVSFVNLGYGLEYHSFPFIKNFFK